MRHAIFFTLVAAFLLSGCFHFRTVIHVDEDGSGTITEQTGMSPLLFAMEESPEDIAEEGISINEERLRERAEQMNVELVDVEPLPDQTGYTATYAFEDVRDVVLTIGDNLDALDLGPNTTSTASDTDTLYTFTLEDGVVTASLPETPPTPGAEVEVFGKTPEPKDILEFRSFLDMLYWNVQLETSSASEQLLLVDGPRTSREVLDNPALMSGVARTESSAGLVPWLRSMEGVPGVVVEEEGQVAL